MLGQIAFSFAVPLLPRHNSLKTPFIEGVNTAIEEFCSDIDINGGLSRKRQAMKMIAEVIQAVRADLATFTEYDEGIVYEVLRSAIFIKERLNSKYGILILLVTTFCSNY